MKQSCEDEERAKTIPLDRSISREERAIAEWLLFHSKPSAISYLPQLEGARITGQCSCGCPTVTYKLLRESLRPSLKTTQLGML